MAVGSGGEKGYKSWLGVGLETSYGTKLTATAFLEFISESLAVNKESTKLETINTSRNPIKRFQGNESVEGTIETYLNPASVAQMHLLNNCLAGTVTSSGDANTGYSHIVYQGDREDSFSSLTLQKRVGNGSTFDFTGCRVNSVSIKGEVGNPISFSAEIIGQHGTISSDTVTVSFPNVIPMLWRGVTFKTGVWDSMTSVLASGATEYIRGFELTINNNLIADETARSMGTATVDFIKHGMAEITFKITQRYDTTTAFVRGFTQTAYAMGLLLDSGITAGSAAGGTTYSMLIELPKCYYKTQTPQVSDANIVTQEIEFDVIASSQGADAISLKYSNATASY
ncbi:MAG: phage tail tube protein [Phycisphaerae bacterium]|nr:phage tail tube protein [Phycisphaerae bacterium]